MNLRLQECVPSPRHLKAEGRGGIRLDTAPDTILVSPIRTWIWDCSELQDGV